MNDIRPARRWGVLTAVAGAASAGLPEPQLRDLCRRLGAVDPLVVRVLGARQVVQGAGVALRPTRRVALLAVATDAAHGASMVALAAASPRHRRPALLSAALAAASAGYGLAARRRLS